MRCNPPPPRECLSFLLPSPGLTAVSPTWTGRLRLLHMVLSLGRSFQADAGHTTAGVPVYRQRCCSFSGGQRVALPWEISEAQICCLSPMKGKPSLHQQSMSLGPTAGACSENYLALMTTCWHVWLKSLSCQDQGGSLLSTFQCSRDGQVYF